MAHIPDGVLAAPVLITGGIVAAGLLGIGLARLREDALPQAAVLSAAFFVSSLISIPLGPTTVHLLLNGLMGLVLSWAAVPAIFVALTLQLVFFGYGGLVSLGVNTMNLALPALAAGFLFRPRLQRLASPSRWGIEPAVSLEQRRRAFAIGLVAGSLAALLTAVMVMLSLILSGGAFVPAAKLIGLTFVPLMMIEGLLTGIVVAFLLRVEPALLALGEPRTGGTQHG